MFSARIPQFQDTIFHLLSISPKKKNSKQYKSVYKGLEFLIPFNNYYNSSPNSLKFIWPSNIWAAATAKDGITDFCLKGHNLIYLGFSKLRNSNTRKCLITAAKKERSQNNTFVTSSSSEPRGQWLTAEPVWYTLREVEIKQKHSWSS